MEERITTAMADRAAVSVQQDGLLLPRRCDFFHNTMSLVTRCLFPV